jgi:hypothetical protein
MGTLPPLILLLWAIGIIVQLIVLFLIVAKRRVHTLPLFFLYIALNLCQAAFLFFVYSHYGFDSPAALQLAWPSEQIVLTAQALAAAEVLYRVLRHYAGIWALSWRLIATAVSIVICYVLASAKLTPSWKLMIANRGFHLTFVVALISCLLLVRFYAIPIDPLYKALMGGFCVLSCTIVVDNTLFQALFLRHFPNSGLIWNSLVMVVFIGVQIVWALALRHPVRVDDKPALLPPATYDRLSPDVNSRLRDLNDILSRFLRLQVLRP